MIYLVSGDKEKAKSWAKEEFSGYDFNFYFADAFRDAPPQLHTETDLFGDKTLYFFDESVLGIFSLKELSLAADSENIFIFFEARVLKKHEKMLDGISFQKKDFIEFKPKAKYDNIFDLAELFAKRDIKNLWLKFLDYRDTKSAEELAGILLWQLKNLALVKTSNENPGMKDFVYKKTQTYAKNFSLQEIKNYSKKIADAMNYRDSQISLMDHLEIIILSK